MRRKHNAPGSGRLPGASWNVRQGSGTTKECHKKQKLSRVCRFLFIYGSTYEAGIDRVIAVWFDENQGAHTARPSSFAEAAMYEGGEP